MSGEVGTTDVDVSAVESTNTEEISELILFFRSIWGFLLIVSVILSVAITIYLPLGSTFPRPFFLAVSLIVSLFALTWTIGKRWELRLDRADLEKVRRRWRMWAWIKFALGLSMLIVYLLSYFALIASPLIKETSIFAEIFSIFFGTYMYTPNEHEYILALSKFLLSVVNIGLLLAYIIFTWLVVSAFTIMGLVEQSHS